MTANSTLCSLENLIKILGICIRSLEVEYLHLLLQWQNLPCNYYYYY
jgi:hypothetical protein